MVLGVIGVIGVIAPQIVLLELKNVKNETETATALLEKALVQIVWGMLAKFRAAISS